MPALTTLSPFNGEATPVAVDFVPRGKNNGVPTFVNSDGVPVGDKRLTVSSTHGTRHKTSIRVRLPETTWLSDAGGRVPQEVEALVNYVRIDFDFDQASTTQQRLDAKAIVASLLNGTDVPIMDEVIVDLNDFY